MTEPHFRHDKIIKKALENPLVAKEFFQMQLPADIKEQFDLDTLKPEKDSFIEESLRDSFVDMLFSVKCKDRDGFIFILLEHQSVPDHFMAFRLKKYMIHILDQYMNKNPKAKKLPIIYPIVLYNGKRKYTVSRNIWGLFEDPEFIKKLWINDYQLINVHEIPDERLKERLWAGTLQFFMKHIWERDLVKMWEEVTGILPELVKVDIGYNYIKILLTYSLTKMEETDKIKLQNILNKALGTKGEEAMVSVAEKWYRDGEARGRVIGEARGEAKLVKMMLKNGHSIQQISVFTGLPTSQIQKLIKSY